MGKDLIKSLEVYFAGNLVLENGKMVMSKEVPTIEGWCAQEDLTMGEFREMCNQDPKLARAHQIAFQRWEHLMMNGGLSGAMVPSPWGLVMKNKAGYTDKSEVKTESTVNYELSEADKRMLERAGVARIT